MKATIAVIAVVLAAGAGFAGGYLPELRRRAGAEEQLRVTRADLDHARAVLQIHWLYDRVLELVTTAEGLDAMARPAPAGPERQAQALLLSTEFFDLVRDEVQKGTMGGATEALAAVLEKRDALTAAVARADPAAEAVLGDVRRLLRPLLADEATGPARSATGSGAAVTPPPSR